jgi:4-hydroxy-4-methyl-2-oxoglutarate aldolase
MADVALNEINLKNYGTAVLYDAARRLKLEVGLRGVRPMTQNRRVVARAYTVRFSAPGQLRGPGLNFYDIMSAAPKDSALVVEVGADRWICGGNMTRFAELSGIRGMVMDGCVRDIAEVRQRDYPIYARGVALTSYAPELVLSEVGGGIVCGGAPVTTGDIVVGDDDGVVCLPAGQLEEILYEAEEIAELDTKLAGDIEARRPLAELHASRTRWAVRRSRAAEPR